MTFERLVVEQTRFVVAQLGYETLRPATGTGGRPKTDRRIIGVKGYEEFALWEEKMIVYLHEVLGKRPRGLLGNIFDKNY